MLGPIRNNFSRPRFPVELAPKSVLVSYILDKHENRIYSSTGPHLGAGPKSGAIGLIGLRSALAVGYSEP